VSEAGAAGRVGAGGPYRLAVLASGNGSNLQAIIDRVHGRATGTGVPVIEIALVVGDQPGAPALDRAKQADIPTELCALDSAGTREAQEAAILNAVRKADPDLVVLAGYMRIVPPEFVRAFSWRIINLHPALLPAFPGTSSIKDALEHGVKVTGVTVHFVDEGLDTGPIIAQEAVRIEEGDDIDSLTARIHAVEHELLPRTIRLLAAGRVRTPLPGTRVVQVDWNE
jgi:phosphoribosylglycinamide formyltransferase-1